MTARGGAELERSLGPDAMRSDGRGWVEASAFRSIGVDNALENQYIRPIQIERTKQQLLLNLKPRYGWGGARPS
jgi:hypothetical protein